MRNKALLLVDIQNDFCPGGALEVASGDEVVDVANRVAKHFDLVIATQDWHPPDHGSFASNHAGGKPGAVIELDGLDQVLWPDHCVQESSGAELRDDLDLGLVKKVFKKGTDPTIDSYSAFYDNGHRKSTGLSDYLKQCDVQDVYIMGHRLLRQVHRAGRAPRRIHLAAHRRRLPRRRACRGRRRALHRRDAPPRRGHHSFGANRDVARGDGAGERRPNASIAGRGLGATVPARLLTSPVCAECEL